MWFLFGVTPGVDSCSRHFETINKQQNGPPHVFVSHCFRVNVNVTCKTVSFSCSLNNFLLKNVIVFFFENQISKCPH